MVDGEAGCGRLTVGVTIVIGEAVPAVHGRGEVRVDAAFAEQPDAPDIAGDRAGRTNTRRPTWSAWRGFARSVGLAELLLDPLDGLTRGPSGCVRLLPGVLGASASLAEESFVSGLLEYPQYMRPRMFEGESIPDVLTSGDHAKIAKWRRECGAHKHQRPRRTTSARLARPVRWPSG